MLDIPGYKWDPEKNRYFKILKTGELPHSSYTVSAVAASGRTEERKRKARFQLDRKREDSAGTVEGRPNNPIGTRKQTYFPGQSAEAVACFAFVNGSPIVGYRDGVIAVPGAKSSEGRSLVALEAANGESSVVGAVVDNAFGSVVAGAGIEVRLPKQFVTGVATAPDTVAVATTAELTLGPLGTLGTRGETTMRLGSLSSVAVHAGQALCGAKNGRVVLADLRVEASRTVFRFPSRRAVTNVAFVGELAVCTGLQDEMFLLDPRAPQPVREFEYANWSTARHGLGVRGEAVAVAQEGAIKVYNLSGSVQASIATEPVPAPCLRWTGDGIFFGSQNKLRLAAKRRIQPARGSVDPAELHSILNQ